MENSLKLTDGGVWETFAFKASDDGYAGEGKWREAIELVERNKGEKLNIYYYPEYEIDLGVPLGRYTVNDEGIYERKFEKGMVLVNPSDTESYTYSLDKGYNNVIPVGGGVLPKHGVPDGYLTYESMNDVLILPPVSGVVLLDAVAAVCGNGICEPDKCTPRRESGADALP